MSKIAIQALSLFTIFISTAALAQTQPEIERILSGIAENNKQLKAYQSYVDSRYLAGQTRNNLDDLEVSGAFYPIGVNESGLLMEFEVSQSFDFPSVYKSRTAYVEQELKQHELGYEKERQRILTEAMDLILQLTFQERVRLIEQTRTEQARQVYLQMEEQFEKEQVGKLDLNKAKISWLRRRGSIERIETEINRLVTSLEGLNGGLELEYTVEGLHANDPGFGMPSLDSLWAEKLRSDPFLVHERERETTAMAQIAVQKKERLPSFGLGLNYEGVKGDNYAGISGGMSIPIWNRRNTVKAAEAEYLYTQRHTDALTSSLYAQTASLYDQYSYLMKRYNDYRSALDAIESEGLLFKAYELGEFSYLEYYMELTFYQEALDEMLEMELEIRQLRNKLLRHNL